MVQHFLPKLSGSIVEAEKQGRFVWISFFEIVCGGRLGTRDLASASDRIWLGLKCVCRSTTDFMVSLSQRYLSKEYR
jgi:hypothetical protein